MTIAGAPFIDNAVGKKPGRLVAALLDGRGEGGENLENTLRRARWGGSG